MEKVSINKRFIEAVSYLLESGSVRSKGELAEKFGIKPSKFSEILNDRMNAGTDLIAQICTIFPDISSDWLLTGEGSMLKSTPSTTLTTPTTPTSPVANQAAAPSVRAAPSDNLNPQPAPTEPTTSTQRTEMKRRKIPLYDIATIGGDQDLRADVDTPATHIAEFVDAGDWFPDATSAIRHYGDSMVEYPAGSILVLRRVLDQRLLINGRNYVIETTEYRITKQLQYDGGDTIIAYSSNRETYPDGRQIHSPIRIPVDTIRHIDLVLGCVQKEYSNGSIPIIRH